MATLAKTAVTFYPTNLGASDFIFNKSGLVVHRLKLVLTGQGGLTNTITAHALGFEIMVYASTLWDATNSKGYPTAIDPANDLLVLLDGSAAPAPVDVTSTVTYVTVIGVPRIGVNT